MNNYPAWGDATLGERAQMVAIQIFAWGVMFPAGLIGIIFVFGMIVEGITEHKTKLSRCQKHAVTPYEYHQCR